MLPYQSSLPLIVLWSEVCGYLLTQMKTGCKALNKNYRNILLFYRKIKPKTDLKTNKKAKLKIFLKGGDKIYTLLYNDVSKYVYKCSWWNN